MPPKAGAKVFKKSPPWACNASHGGDLLYSFLVEERFSSRPPERHEGSETIKEKHTHASDAQMDPKHRPDLLNHEFAVG